MRSVSHFCVKVFFPIVTIQGGRTESKIMYVRKFKKLWYLRFRDPAHSLRTTWLLRIAELASSPNSQYQNFFFTHADYFRLHAIPLDVQNREKLSQENDTKTIELSCFQKVICFLWIHSLIKVKQLDRVICGSYSQQWFVSDTFFSDDQVPHSK